MSVLLELAMFPTDRGESVGAYVAPIVKLIADSGHPYRLTPMGTVIETDELTDALALVDRACKLLEEQGCRRIYATLKLDIRRDRRHGIDGKIDSVTARIGEVKT